MNYKNFEHRKIKIANNIVIFKNVLPKICHTLNNTCHIICQAPGNPGFTSEHTNVGGCTSGQVANSGRDSFLCCN